MKIAVLAIFALASFGESAESSGCPEKWVALTDTCSLEGGDDCVLLGRPNKYLSWSHHQFMCDAEGGFLPELTQANAKKVELILKSYHLLYGDTLLYLGATTITRANDWKWMNSHKSVTEDTSLLTEDANKDCLAMKSGTTELVNIDCQSDDLETQVAYVCMKKVTNGEGSVEKEETGDTNSGCVSCLSARCPDAGNFLGKCSKNSGDGPCNENGSEYPKWCLSCVKFSNQCPDCESACDELQAPESDENEETECVSCIRQSSSSCEKSSLVTDNGNPGACQVGGHEYPRFCKHTVGFVCTECGTACNKL